MVVRCPDCRARYEISTEGMDVASLKVRCPRCKAVFPVRPAEPEPVPSPHAHPTGIAPEGVVEAPRKKPGITDPQMARRLARAMVSEIVLNRQADRKDALADGSLLSRFGPAIRAAYGMYTTRVSPRVPGSRGIFREAVNEILGDSHPVL